MGSRGWWTRNNPADRHGLRLWPSQRHPAKSAYPTQSGRENRNAATSSSPTVKMPATSRARGKDTIGLGMTPSRKSCFRAKSSRVAGYRAALRPADVVRTPDHPGMDGYLVCFVLLEPTGRFELPTGCFRSLEACALCGRIQER